MKRRYMMIGGGIMLLLMMATVAIPGRIKRDRETPTKIETTNPPDAPAPAQREVQSSTDPVIEPAPGNRLRYPTGASSASATYIIDWQSINGGGEDMQSTSYDIQSSIGQSLIGYVTSSNYEIGAGYWYGVSGGDCTCPTHGDPAVSGQVDVFDVLAVVSVAFQNGAPVVDAGCSFANTDVSATGACSGAVDVFDVLAFVSVAFQNGSTSQFCDPCL